MSSAGLYGQHVDVLHVHGRVLVVAGPVRGRGADLTAAMHVRRADAMHQLWTRIFEPGFFSSAPVHTAAVIGAAVAVVSAVVGVFTVMRGQSFGGHALGDVSAAGGSGALLIGLSPLVGFVGLGIVGAGVMDTIGVRRVRGRDLATGIVLGAAIGLSALFLYLDTTARATTGATQQILFGSIFTTAGGTIPVVAFFSALALGLHRDHLPPAAAEHGQHRHRRRAGCPGPPRRSALHAGPGPVGRPVVGSHRRHLVHRAADRAGCRGAAPDSRLGWALRPPA